MTEAKKAANKRYIDSLDEFKVRLPQGTKDQIREHIKKTDDNSVNGFFARAISETIERDNEKNK